MDNVNALKSEIEELKKELDKQKEATQRNWDWFQNEVEKNKKLELRLVTIKNIVEF